MGVTRGRGRPALPPEERASRTLRARLTPPQHADLLAWSEREGRPLAELVVEVAMRAAKRSAKRAEP